ncbi:hypothetical protein JXR01_03040 [Candidatus Kaiserbacteria bacterium]|nr:MAG: hypothetical protein JXR01_03040 [Candidatus Kaiserbacteria bacterium]
MPNEYIDLNYVYFELAPRRAEREPYRFPDEHFKKMQAAGFVLEKAGGHVYCHSLPHGWTIGTIPHEEKGWETKGLFDDQHRCRGEVNVNVGDRSPEYHTTLLTRFRPYNNMLGGDEGVPCSTIIIDRTLPTNDLFAIQNTESAKVIRSIPGTYEDIGKHKESGCWKQALAWLDEKYPEWQDPFAYW